MAAAVPTTARIVGAGMTALYKSQPLTAVQLMVQALQLAVEDTQGLLALQDIDTLIALPSLMSDQHFMIAHAVAQEAKLTPRKGMLVRTLDVGGAGPVAALLAAKRAIEHEGRQAVAIVAGDTVASAPLQDFLARADASCRASSSSSSSSVESVPSPVIPNLYDKVARWHMQQYGTTREQLAMCASLMTFQASHHPGAMHKRPRLLQEVLSSAPVAPVTTKLECAKLADGAAALVLVPGQKDSGSSSSRGIAVLGGGEASGPLSPPAQLSEDCFSAGEAAAAAYSAAALQPTDIDYWGLYDCFPICLIRAVEAVGLAAKGHGGAYIEQQYQHLLGPLEQQRRQQQAGVQGPQNSSTSSPGCSSGSGSSSSLVGGLMGMADSKPSPGVWPVNTHGGLLGFGAPWEVPAMIGLVEAVAQLRGEAAGRQVQAAARALVYGNGGIFSASAVAILESGAARKARVEHQHAHHVTAGTKPKL